MDTLVRTELWRLTSQFSIASISNHLFLRMGKDVEWNLANVLLDPSLCLCVCVCIHLARVLHWVYPSNNESSSRDANARLDYILMAIKITAPLLLHYYCCSRPLQCIYMCLRHFSAVLCLLLVPKNGFTFDLVALLNQSLLLLSEVMAKTEVDKSNIFNRFKLTPLVRTCICSKCVCVCVWVIMWKYGPKCKWSPFWALKLASIFLTFSLLIIIWHLLLDKNHPKTRWQESLAKIRTQFFERST